MENSSPCRGDGRPSHQEAESHLCTLILAMAPGQWAGGSSNILSFPGASRVPGCIRQLSGNPRFLFPTISAEAGWAQDAAGPILGREQTRQTWNLNSELGFLRDAGTLSQEPGAYSPLCPCPAWSGVTRAVDVRLWDGLELGVGGKPKFPWPMAQGSEGGG